MPKQLRKAVNSLLWCTHTGIFTYFGSLDLLIGLCLTDNLLHTSPFLLILYTSVEAIISSDLLACTFASDQRIVILSFVLFTCGKVYKKCTKAAKSIKGHTCSRLCEYSLCVSLPFSFFSLPVPVPCYCACWLNDMA